ncbi:MAG: translation elongation factor 4 [Candidatus Paceibacterota bacterium]
MENIRNFCIIAHIDHGKSTLADRLLEVTGTIEKRKMKAQYLDQLELERERGITIKMAPVRMAYKMQNANIKNQNGGNVKPDPAILNFDSYILNLIDTPGHPDFGYEVSRALEAVEGAVVLVDATQGIQAQTLSNLYAAQRAGLTIIGAVNKIDAPNALPEQTAHDLAHLLKVDSTHIHRVSGKTGAGVDELLRAIVAQVPMPRVRPLAGPRASGITGRGLIFDSFYDDHKGIIAVVRIVNGAVRADDMVSFGATGKRLKIKEVGYFVPQQKICEVLEVGDIGFVVTGLKDPHLIKIGDTLIASRVQIPDIRAYALPGYREPKPVVFVSLYPDDPDEYDELKKSLEKLKLNDSSFVFDPDNNEVLGRGFKGGFLGKLHFEIIAQRLEKEFGVKTITSFPSVAYRVKLGDRQKEKFRQDEMTPDGLLIVKTPKDLPDEYDAIYEPMIRVEIVCPKELLGSVLGLKELFRWQELETTLLGDRMIIGTRMPLAELISDFDDRLKSVSGGFASFNYEEDGFEKADLSRADILVANELVPGLSRILPRQSIEHEARQMTKRLKETLPHQQFPQAIQAKAFGRIIARETIPAFKKELGNFGKNGGDRTRKMKLWKKQKEGKKKLLSLARVKISAQDFKKLLAK